MGFDKEEINIRLFKQCCSSIPYYLKNIFLNIKDFYNNKSISLILKYLFDQYDQLNCKYAKRKWVIH